MSPSNDDDRRDASIKAALHQLANSYRPSLTSERLAAARRRRGRIYGPAALGVAIIVAIVAVTVGLGSSRTQHPAAAPATHTPVAQSGQAAPVTPPTSVAQARTPAAPSPAVSPGESHQTSHRPTATGRHLPACTAKQLQVTVKVWGFTMPGNVANIIFRNTSTTTCTLAGWPTVKVLHATGDLPVTTRISYRPGTSQLGPVPVTLVTLAPSASAKSGLLIRGPGGCTGHPFAWLITAPGTGNHTRIPEDYASDQANGFGVCSSQTPIVVSPVRP